MRNTQVYVENNKYTRQQVQTWSFFYYYQSISHLTKKPHSQIRIFLLSFA